MSSRSTSARPRTGVGRRTVALAAPTVGLGTSVTTVLRTSFFANVTAAASGIANTYLKPGSCFDPCGDLGTLQPQMFDQFAEMYARYKVNSCLVRITVIGANSANSANHAWCFAAYPSIDSTAIPSYQNAASQQYAKTLIGGFQRDSSVGIGAEPKTVTFKLNHNAIVGAKSDTWDIGAPVSSDPPTSQFMVLPMIVQSNYTATAAFIYHIDMFQNVTFSQKKNTIDA